MTTFLSGIFLFLVSSLAYAQDNGGPANAPVETVGMVWVVLFIILFIGVCVGFFVLLWWNERKRQREAGEHEKQPHGAGESKA